MGARVARHELVFGRTTKVATMMQSCASAARLRGGGPILNRGAKAIVQRRVAAASVRRLPAVRVSHGDARTTATPSWLRRRAKLEPFWRFAGRGEPPQDGMRQLRASATIIVLRVPPRASAVRIRYHALSGLPFWCVR